jgi:transcriptional regulator with XRE-family HTH domain
MPMGKSKKEGENLKQQLWEICRDKKDSINPRITNQQLAEQSGLSQNAVGQYLRGESPNAPLTTFGPICKILGVSIDEYLGIGPCSGDAWDAATAERLTSAEKLNEIYAQELQRKSTLIAFLLLIVIFVLGALVYDLCNPNVGWIRDTMSILREVAAHV